MLKSVRLDACLCALGGGGWVGPEPLPVAWLLWLLQQVIATTLHRSSQKLCVCTVSQELYVPHTGGKRLDRDSSVRWTCGRRFLAGHCLKTAPSVMAARMCWTLWLACRVWEVYVPMCPHRGPTFPVLRALCRLTLSLCR